ncbi:MAG TPA: amidohydrolase family protein [Methanofastidiosum sp.]|nr:amidohydrolase family protein [Methanofastidiosum sp.]
MSEFDIIIKNAKINENTISDIGIRNGAIEKLGKLENGLKTIDAEGKFVLNGFVNSHCHLDKSNLLDKMGEGQFGKSLEENRRLLKELKSTYSKKDIQGRASIAIEKMLAKGVTAIRTQVDVDSTCGLVPIEALLQVKKKYEGRVSIEISAFPQEGVVGDEKNELMEKAIEKGANVVGGLPLVEDKTNQKKHLNLIFEIAKKYGKSLDIQVDESNDPRTSILPELIKKTSEEKFFNRVNVTHAISLSRFPTQKALGYIDEMARLGMSVIVTPSANMITRFVEESDVWMRPSNSITRVTELCDKGIQVSLGTDNIRDIFYPFGNCSMIRELHMLISATRMTSKDHIDKAFEMATINGAKLLGLNYGIEPGKDADLIITNSFSKIDILNNDEIVPCTIKNGKIQYIDKSILRGDN